MRSLWEEAWGAGRGLQTDRAPRKSLEKGLLSQGLVRDSSAAEVGPCAYHLHAACVKLLRKLPSPGSFTFKDSSVSFPLASTFSVPWRVGGLGGQKWRSPHHLPLPPLQGGQGSLAAAVTLRTPEYWVPFGTQQGDTAQLPICIPPPGHACPCLSGPERGLLCPTPHIPEQDEPSLGEGPK